MGQAIVTAVLVDEAALTLEELAQACAVEPDWVVQRVRTGILLDSAPQDSVYWRFTSADLVRARRLCQVERDFEANDDVAALVVDLSEEIRRLRGKLSAAGVK
ncbi:chaperone modulator CbpM [Duganella aceris]|jgi:chaperone modulatory protein CbpM|uniref:MerR family transcriptional regulator n=1 Tax=Duganella aceris TaxID=2703883 RepID=A0ABX0FTE2_9BURK|nr:chaperone modulator CbpM [Duganella aceris]NGZ87736.1 MerR family transcriptional regulator [Duganella aceris]